MSRPESRALLRSRDGNYRIGTTGGLYRFKRDAISQPDAAKGNRPKLNAQFIDGSRGALFESRKGNPLYSELKQQRTEATQEKKDLQRP